MAVVEDVPPAVRRHTAIWRWSGVAGGLAAAVAAALAGALGRGLLLAAPIFGIFVLAGVLAGELSVPAPTGRTRRAGVAVRRTADYLPRGLAAAVALAVAALLAVLTVTTAMGSADDAGRAGRFLVRQCSAVLTEGHGAWAGSFYSVPLGVVIAAGLTGAAVALRRVVRRPRAGDPANTATADDWLRRRAARAVVGACGVLVTVPLIGVSVVTAAGFLSIGCRPAWWTAAAWALLALLPVWTGILAWSGLAVLAPSQPAAAAPGV